ncbi:MAG: OsmC family protein [Flavipsychrobacter sp.]|nr:OsmC family protein [Flavipsychrobacter sp.]
MEQVKANIGQELFKIEITSPSGNVVIADEPITKGGQDRGFSPKELLAASLAACTCATLKMYASHKAWDLQKVIVEITLLEEEGKTTFNRALYVEGNLDEEQRARLLSVANACPIHKILTHQIEINTQLV